MVKRINLDKLYNRGKMTKKFRHIPIERIEQELIHCNGLVSVAARRLGISPQALYERIKNHTRLQDAIKIAREELVDIAEVRLRVAVNNGESWAIALVLKTMGKNRGYTERHEITGADGEEIVIRYINDWRHNEKVDA